MTPSRRLTTLLGHVRAAPVGGEDLPDIDWDGIDDREVNLEFAAHSTPTAQGGLRPLLSHATGDFGTISRGDPLPHTLDHAALASAGLTADTWSLQVAADPFIDPPHVKIPAAVSSPLRLDLAGLKALGRAHGTVKVLKAVQCLNVDSPLGQGLWEGVPLSTVLRACGRLTNVRRVNFWGYHNDDPRQVFRSSVSYTEAMEPGPGEPPVLLAYALNGEPLCIERGGPVRMIVPHGHGFKSVKWLQHITVTNDHRASDTYASMDTQGNDPSSSQKTYATIEPMRGSPVILSGSPVMLSGVVMSGRTAVSHVEYWVREVAEGEGRTSRRIVDDDDPELLAAPWQRCKLQAPPADAAAWAQALPLGTRPDEVFGIDETGVPLRWPLPYSYTGFSATVEGLAPGRYELRARSVDANGHAQPQPRPSQKSGKNGIGVRVVTVV
jgi:DMSO/TMAO reductase YedYZ molybdopterin-dependent catalytic subunit